MFILPELSLHVLAYANKKVWSLLRVCRFFSLDCFDRRFSPLLIFVLEPKHFSPRMSEGSASLQFLLSLVTFFCHRKEPERANHNTGLQSRTAIDIFTRRYRSTIARPSAYSLVLLCFALTLKALTWKPAARALCRVPPTTLRACSTVYWRY